MKTKGILFTVLGVLLLAGLCGGGLGLRYYTAEVRGVVGAEEQIQSAPNRIVQYNYFFDLCAAIQGHEATLQAAKVQLETAIGDKEVNRINANIAGITGQRARAIAQYNVDAAKGYTRGQFRDSQLPYNLNAEGKTIC